MFQFGQVWWSLIKFRQILSKQVDNCSWGQRLGKLVKSIHKKSNAANWRRWESVSLGKQSSVKWLMRWEVYLLALLQLSIVAKEICKVCISQFSLAYSARSPNFPCISNEGKCKLSWTNKFCIIFEGISLNIFPVQFWSWKDWIV